MFKKITDERLKLKNLKNIRILFIVQSLGIIGILFYEIIKNGIENMTNNPVWFVFILTAIVGAYLQIGISIDHENGRSSPSKGLAIFLIIAAIIALLGGFTLYLTEGVFLGLLIGGIIFLCFLFPAVYVYYLRKKRK